MHLLNINSKSLVYLYIYVCVCVCLRQAQTSLTYERKPIKGNTRYYVVNMLYIYMV